LAVETGLNSQNSSYRSGVAKAWPRQTS
jgi:hypothetical protein